MHRISNVLLALILAVFGGSARAGIIAYSVAPGTNGNQSYPNTLGMDFDVLATAGVDVTSLGVFDSGSDGITNGGLNAELFARNNNGTPNTPGDDIGGAVLATMSFTTADPGTLMGGHRFKDLASPLHLAQGSYTMVAYNYDGANGEQNGNSQAATNFSTTNDGGGLLNFVGTSRYGTGVQGAFPTNLDGAVARYGAGSFIYQAVPEPASAMHFACSLLALLIGYRRI